MDDDSMKKAGVVAIVLLLIAYCIAVPVMWMVLDAPIWVCAVIAVLFLVVAVAMVYQARVRIREIEEGLEDAVYDY